MAFLTSKSLFSSMLMLSFSLFILSCHDIQTAVGESLRFPEVQMIIQNDLGGNIPLQLHCQSKDDDIGGWHELGYHQTLTWRFTPRYFWRTTLFWCTMQWKSATGLVTGSFNVYDQEWDLKKCRTECLWSIRPDAAYAFNQQNQTYELRHPWW